MTSMRVRVHQSTFRQRIMNDNKPPFCLLLFSIFYFLFSVLFFMFSMLLCSVLSRLIRRIRCSSGMFELAHPEKYHRNYLLCTTINFLFCYIHIYNMMDSCIKDFCLIIMHFSYRRYIFFSFNCSMLEFKIVSSGRVTFFGNE